MKSTGVMFQDFSIEGLRKQWEYEKYIGELMSKFPDATDSEGRFYFGTQVINTSNIGCKTETRRTRGLDKVNENPNDWVFTEFTDNFPEIGKGNYAMFFSKSQEDLMHCIKCPYGVVGDEIWVKEKWKPRPFSNDFHYYFDDVYSKERKGLLHELYDWKSPLFMPKAASRIKLEITNISIERLQDITEEGAKREGIVFNHFMKLEWDMWFGKENVPQSAKEMYRNLWIKMHGKESWNKNPFVWVIQFNVKEFK